jgi:diguanylate cyclase (GGDEF)-like protein/PAS domain S-box-containing protein
MPETLKILLLEDSLADAELVSWELNHANLHHALKRVETKDEYLHALTSYEPDVILSDHSMPGYDGMSALRAARKKRPATPFIFVSGTLGEDRAVDSLKQGASDYVVKGDMRRLPSSILRAIEEIHLRHDHEVVIQKLRTSEATFKSLAEQAPVGIMLADTAGKTTFCNNHWGRIVGRTVDDAASMDWAELFHPDDRERVIGVITKLMEDRQPVVIEYQLLKPDGETRWVTSQVVPQYSPDGKFSGFISMLTDNTEQKLAEQKIARLSRIQEVLSSINSTIVRVSERETLCEDVCRIAVDKGLFTLAWVGLLDQKSKNLTHSCMLGNDEALLQKMRAGSPTTLAGIAKASRHAELAYTSGKPVIIDPVSLANYDARWLSLLNKAGVCSVVQLPLRLNDSTFGILTLATGSTGFFTEDEMRLLNELAEDIAFALDHLEKQERLNYLAYYDSLTELPNRTLFLDHLKQQVFSATSEGYPFAVLSFDIERFRHINESFGESSGDALLLAVARRLLANNDNPGLLGRLGGDSFGSILPRIESVEMLAHTIERSMREWMATPFQIANEEIVVPFKIGVAIFPTDGKDADTLLQNANAALKQAKASHERTAFYAQRINAQVSEQLHFETRLRNAVDQKQFVLHYQPKINLQTGRIGSVEALMRWQDPERGLVPPGEFIPLLEETGLIYNMGMWALQRAFDDHAKLRKLFSYAPYIAVNVSAIQLQRKTFYADVLQVIEQAADGRHGIDIEVTESLIMYDIEDNIRKLNEVRSHNVHIAVDDFGTGYSSLSYIAKLPIDVLKIDRSFIIKMSESEVDLAIVSAIITLAHSLNLRVVAEGVETEQQAQILRSLNCDEAQGYLFCRPLPFDELVKRLTMTDDVVVLKEGIQIHTNPPSPTIDK